MVNRDINKLYEKSSILLTKLTIVFVENGIHLDNDLETKLFCLLLDEDYEKML